ncbi:nucleoside-diphosphate sugar epimerase [Paenibacillus sp. 481]|uniref:nucleoside-diphosphate sugar epimerase n=1 Tax=Paenibacillus sp. 481 TaxID=2835869 RepID=UPI001E537040|nr:nucleoside-diphosphate sugar epimerase [Paenibacillus sp. 481]UHA74508.1 nucleoside-diphosphate sugar epimerase [Paenibacillus sp. 481]
MHQVINELISHMSHTHQHMARLLDAERHVAVRMSQIIQALPDTHPEFEGISGIKDQSAIVTKSIISYLNSLAELEEAMADQLKHVMQELHEAAEE